LVTVLEAKGIVDGIPGLADNTAVFAARRNGDQCEGGEQGKYLVHAARLLEGLNALFL
jgi:hypothetical protein